MLVQGNVERFKKLSVVTVVIEIGKSGRGLDIQLLLKSLNTPADLLSQLCQCISLILRLYACSTSTNLIASVQRP